MNNYKTMADIIGNRKSKKLAPNTYLLREQTTAEKPALIVRLHDTDILTFSPSGRVTMTSGSWRTPTTKGRLNAFGPCCWYQHEGQWLHDGKVFSDNCQWYQGKLSKCLSNNKQKKAAKLKKQIAEFSRKCGDALPLLLPGNGDCWYCLMKTTTGETLGDFSKNHYHLLLHMADGYIVPSMVLSAMTEAGLGDIFKAAAFGQGGETFLGEAKEHVNRAMRKYLTKRLGGITR